MELPDNSTAGKSLLCDTKEEEVMFFYGNWSPPKNPHGESPCQHLPDEEPTACAVELTPTEVKVLTTTHVTTGMLKTCSEDQMSPPTPSEDKVLLSCLLDDTKKLPAPDMMFVLAHAEDGMIQHMTCPKDGELTFAHGKPAPAHDHHADGELPLVLLLYDTKLGKFPGKLGTLGLPVTDGGRNYPPPKAMQSPLPAPEPPPLLC